MVWLWGALCAFCDGVFDTLADLGDGILWAFDSW